MLSFEDSLDPTTKSLFQKIVSNKASITDLDQRLLQKIALRNSYPASNAKTPQKLPDLGQVKSFRVSGILYSVSTDGRVYATMSDGHTYHLTPPEIKEEWQAISPSILNSNPTAKPAGYEISLFGQIRNATSLMSINRREDKGYLRVCLHVGEKSSRGRSIWFPVHRLMGRVFIPNPDQKPVVHHVDGNKQNNHITNLRWATYSENTHASLLSQFNISPQTNLKIDLLRTLSPTSIRASSLKKDILATGISKDHLIQILNWKKDY